MSDAARRDAFKRDVEAAIEAGDPEELLGVVIDVALAADDVGWATDRLCALARHPSTDVRGNALMAFTHLADRLDAAGLARVVPILRAALDDPERYVREQAEAALDELGLGED